MITTSTSGEAIASGVIALRAVSVGGPGRRGRRAAQVERGQAAISASCSSATAHPGQDALRGLRLSAIVEVGWQLVG